MSLPKTTSSTTLSCELSPATTRLLNAGGLSREAPSIERCGSKEGSSGPPPQKSFDDCASGANSYFWGDEVLETGDGAQQPSRDIVSLLSRDIASLKGEGCCEGGGGRGRVGITAPSSFASQISRDVFPAAPLNEGP
eukprot:scaffold7017_cov75-Phaeocystis_antarctica.AAC.6